MSSSSARGQTEPLAALVAVAAVAVGLSLYAGALDDAFEDAPDREIAEPTLDRVERTLAPAGVVEPASLPDGRVRVPAGYDVNITLTTDREWWSTGPVPPADESDSAGRLTSVLVGPTDVRPGRFQVVVW
jgi:hypothetical protein